MLSNAKLNQAREAISMLFELSKHVRSGFEGGLNQAQRISRFSEVYGSIQIGLMPVIAWMERRRSVEAARQATARMFDAIGCAQHLVTLEIPEYLPNAVVDEKTSERSIGCSENAILGVQAKLAASFFDDVLAEIRTEQEHLQQLTRTLQAQEHAANSQTSRGRKNRNMGESKPRGRRPDPDDASDAKIAEKWVSPLSLYTKYEDLAAELNRGQPTNEHSAETIRLALDRHRHRQRKAAAGRSGVAPE